MKISWIIYLASFVSESNLTKQPHNKSTVIHIYEPENAYYRAFQPLFVYNYYLFVSYLFVPYLYLKRVQDQNLYLDPNFWRNYGTYLHLETVNGTYEF